MTLNIIISVVVGSPWSFVEGEVYTYSYTIVSSHHRATSGGAWSIVEASSSDNESIGNL